MNKYVLVFVALMLITGMATVCEGAWEYFIYIIISRLRVAKIHLHVRQKVINVHQQEYRIKRKVARLSS